MADVTINALQHANNFKATMACTVWTSSTTGYVFYINSVIDLVYKKTTNSGATWGSEVTIRAGTIDCFGVWYDKWTPGASGTKIHIGYNDSVIDDTLYRNLDTSGDTLSSEVQVFNGVSYTGIVGLWTDRFVSVTRARGGNLYLAFDADGGTEFGFFRSVDGGVTWTSRATTASNNGFAHLLPANTSDSQDVCFILIGSLLNGVFYQPYDDSANTWGSTSILSGTFSSTYFQMAASVRHSDNHIILAVWNELDTATADLLVYDVNPSDSPTATAKTNVISNTAEFAQCCVCIDQNNGTIYVGYLGGVTWLTDAHVFHKSSTDGGGTWSAQSAAHDETTDNQRVLWCDLGGTDTRFYPIWQNFDLDDLLGNVASSIAITPSGDPPELSGIRRMISVP
jgi:hypothetical protein